MNENKKRRFIVLVCVCEALLIIGFVASLLNEDEIDFSSMQTWFVIGIWSVLAIILGVLCIVYYATYCDNDTKKQMEKLQQKKSYNLSKIGYFMIQSTSKTRIQTRIFFCRLY